MCVFVLTLCVRGPGPAAGWKVERCACVCTLPSLSLCLRACEYISKRARKSECGPEEEASCVLCSSLTHSPITIYSLTHGHTRIGVERELPYSASERTRGRRGGSSIAAGEKLGLLACLLGRAPPRTSRSTASRSSSSAKCRALFLGYNALRGPRAREHRAASFASVQHSATRSSVYLRYIYARLIDCACG